MFTSPRFTGAVQAFGGVAEALAGKAMILGSCGVGAVVGGAVVVHGLDQMVAGISMMVTGGYRLTATEQTLRAVGVPSDWASATNDAISIAGTTASIVITRIAKSPTMLNSKAPPHLASPGGGANGGAAAAVVKKASRNRFVPDINAKGAHTVFRRDPLTGKVTHYETYMPQTNPNNPNVWESIKRFDNSGKIDQRHFNKVLKKEIYEPHVHDPLCPGGVRTAETWEIP